MIPILQNNTALKMTTREVADLTEKNHSHVYRDAVNMLEQLGYTNEQVDGCHQEWIHPQNKQKYYELALNRDETLCLVAGYSAPLRMKIIKRLDELENKAQSPAHIIPKTYAEALMLAANQAAQLEQQAPMVEVYKLLADRKGDVSTTIIAKELGTTAIKLNKFLRDKGIKWLNADLPKAGYEKYFNVVADVKNGHEFTQCLVTPDGQIAIAKLWGEK